MGCLLCPEQRRVDLWDAPEPESRKEAEKMSQKVKMVTMTYQKEAFIKNSYYFLSSKAIHLRSWQSGEHFPGALGQLS